MSKRTFENTRKALVEFDEMAAQRAHAWTTIETNDEVEACAAADTAALNKVREAYYLDTKDINSRENCMRVDLEFMRKMVERNHG